MRKSDKLYLGGFAAMLVGGLLLYRAGIETTEEVIGDCIDESNQGYCLARKGKKGILISPLNIKTEYDED